MIPKPALIHIQNWAHHGPCKEALTNLVWLGFFFLLCPGEYVWTNSNPHPFTLEDVTFKIATVAYNAATIPMELLGMVTYVGMHFTEQKNGIKNETIGPSCSLDQTACPVLVAI
jgi:hypothetical protein